MPPCIFCQIRDNTAPALKIWENEDFLAFLDINPVNAGHTLLIPKIHVDQLFDLEEPIYSELFRLSKQLSAPLQKAMNSTRVGLVIEGFGVPHAHVHLVPINSSHELDPSRAKAAEWDALEVIAKKIRAELK